MTSSSKRMNLSAAIGALGKVAGCGHPVVFETPDKKRWAISELVTQQILLGDSEIESIVTTIHLVRLEVQK